MKKFGRIIGSAAVLLAASATAAHADLGGLINGTQYCGGNTFSTCATINTISYSGGVLTLQITNTSGNAGSVFTEIGLANIGGTFGSTFGASGDGIWQAGTSGLSGAGIQNAVIGGEATPPSPTNGLHDGETVTFTFTLTGNPDLTDLQLAIHDQGGSPEGCDASTK